jgi:SAM-dependent methyltransferase
LKPAYIHTELIHNLNAPREVVPIIMDLVKPTSLLDVGCGTGTWLKAFEEKGISDYVGVDADYLDRTLLQIPEAKFKAVDLRTSWTLGRKFDLVISLEVAEHLPEKNADSFVATLVSYAETIVFSAAVPGQGGQNHLNEQWPDYWQRKFLKHGFYFHDVIRPLIWYNNNVDWWYKQNIFLLNKNKEIAGKKLQQFLHPDFVSAVQRRNDQYVMEIIEGRQGFFLGLRIFYNSVIFKLKMIIKRGTH